MALAPSRLQDFRLDAKIGTGSTSRVFDAHHLASGQRVAIKMLEPAASTSHELRERLAREAILLSQVTSRHVAKVIGFGYENDKPFLVLERLVGETLDHFIKREKLSFAQLTLWIEELLLGLRDIHSAGIIHRDVKPSNVFLSKTTTGQIVVKLIDFGVARLRDASLVKDVLTSTNHVIGSLGYMAPEQFHRARAVTNVADLYAVGVVIFRMISGRLPFANRSLDVVLKMKSEQDPPRLSSIPYLQIHPLLDDFVFRSLAREPEMRYQTAREMLEGWWRATSASGAEPPPPPETIAEGIDVDFSEPSSLEYAKTESMAGAESVPGTESLPFTATAPAAPAPSLAPAKSSVAPTLKSPRSAPSAPSAPTPPSPASPPSERPPVWVELDPNQITRPR